MDAVVNLKSGRRTVVDDLLHLLVRTSEDSSQTKVTDFSSFRILPGHEITFIGSESTVVFPADEIEFLNFRSK